MSRLVQPSENIYEGQWRPECVICKESVELEESKVDEHGQAIHEVTKSATSPSWSDRKPRIRRL
jgi:hypothetical protein